MKKRRNLHLTSKWLKTRAIRKDRIISGLIPETRRMNRDSLRSMLRKYTMVYIKPDSGTFGNGVMRVERLGGGYRYQSGVRKHSFRSYEQLYSSILRNKPNRSYLVQRGIHLLKYKGRRFDVRVMTQVNPRRQWESTGVIGRVAHPRKIVTNYHSGGSPTALGILLPSSKRARIESKLKAIGLRAAKVLRRSYPSVNMVGTDIGLDKAYRPWIIEVNTNPDPYLFRFLRDKSVHRKVIRYARALGRIK